jgi:E3 ubiquitin-protein ligase NRDP1
MEEMKLQRDIVGVVVQKYVWDESTLPKEVKMSDDQRSLYLQEDDYLFRTVYANIELNEGIHYWEIIADARSEHELKIGVSGQKLMNQKAAFSDYEYGWAFFGVGQLRHNSNSVGPKYGKPFKRHGVLGIFLNMNKGTLSYALDG